MLNTFRNEKHKEAAILIQEMMRHNSCAASAMYMLQVARPIRFAAGLTSLLYSCRGALPMR